MNAPDQLRSLRAPAEVERRRALARDARHLAPLQPYLAALRRRHGEVPDPDPQDGGADARLLLLLETPGPRIRGTGFVSRDNPTGTAANLFRFLQDAAIPRADTLIWNLVPCIIHPEGALNRAPHRREIEAGLDCLADLLVLLRHLQVVILAGRVAGQARRVIEALRPGLPVVCMPHPSPTYVCTDPAVATRIVAALREAAALLMMPAERADAA